MARKKKKRQRQKTKKENKQGERIVRQSFLCANNDRQKRGKLAGVLSCFGFVLAYLISFCQLSSCQHGGKRNVIHSRVRRQIGGNGGILHRRGFAGSRGNTALSHGRHGQGTGRNSMMPRSDSCKGTGSAAKEGQDGGENCRRRSHGQDKRRN